MLYKREQNPLIVVLGPTASGKTDLAIHIAEQLGGEIISGDSRLFYRGMDIGTAKPTAAQLARVPHYLVDILDPDEPFSLALFQQLCTEKIVDIRSRGLLPILVGGTGQYIQAITQAWQIPEQAADLRLREVLEKIGREQGVDTLFRYLQKVDPPAAEVIDRRNLRRVVRALEVIYHTGRRFSSQKVRGDSPYDLIQIGISWTREDLYQRIDTRIDQMLSEGLVDEVKRLMTKGYTPALPSMSAIGYNEIYAYLVNEITLEDAIVLVKRKTRQFVRRQANWFKPYAEDINWFEQGQDLHENVCRYIQSRLTQTIP
jgi:tRNA dimethylallyltransferase